MIGDSNVGSQEGLVPNAISGVNWSENDLFLELSPYVLASDAELPLGFCPKPHPLPIVLV